MAGKYRYANFIKNVFFCNMKMPSLYAEHFIWIYTVFQKVVIFPDIFIHMLHIPFYVPSLILQLSLHLPLSPSFRFWLIEFCHIERWHYPFDFRQQRNCTEVSCILLFARSWCTLCGVKQNVYRHWNILLPLKLYWRHTDENQMNAM